MLQIYELIIFFHLYWIQRTKPQPIIVKMAAGPYTVEEQSPWTVLGLVVSVCGVQ